MAPSAPPAPTKRVQLVDEENRILCAADFVHHRLDSLFKLTAILGAGHHHRQIQHNDSAVGHQFGHVSIDDSLCQAFDDGGLADARLAQEHGVVFRPPAEDLHRAFDFLLAADHGIEFRLARQFGQVTAETVEGRGFRFAALGRLRG